MRYNPLPQQSYRRGASSDPRRLRSAQRKYKQTAITAGGKLQREIWRWLGQYGMSTKGYTFMSQDTYIKQLLTNFDEGDMDGYNDGLSLSLRDTKKVLNDFSFSAPLFILTSGEHYDDLHSLLQGTTESYFFKKLKKSHFKDDPDADYKVDLIREKLLRELHKLIESKGWRIGEAIPEKLYVYLTSGYPHDSYSVFPVYPIGKGRSDRFTNMIPFYRKNPDSGNWYDGLVACPHNFVEGECEICDPTLYDDMPTFAEIMAEEDAASMKCPTCKAVEYIDNVVDDKCECCRGVCHPQCECRLSYEEWNMFATGLDL